MGRSLISFVAICLLLSPLGEARSGGAHPDMPTAAAHADCCSDSEECKTNCGICVTGCAQVTAAADNRRDSSPRHPAPNYGYRNNARPSWTDPPAGEPPK